MSKILVQLHQAIINSKSWKKFFKQQAPGGRIFPSQTGKNDTSLQLRYDAGEVVDGKKKINLQINSQAKSPALKEFISNKKGTHANVASAEISMDTPEDKQEEVVKDLFKNVAAQYKSKIGQEAKMSISECLVVPMQV